MSCGDRTGLAGAADIAPEPTAVTQPEAAERVSLALRLRPLQAEDAGRLARLAAHAGGSWDERRFASSLAGQAAGWTLEPLCELALALPPAAEPSLVAALRPPLAAAILVLPGPDDWEVLDLAVAPACQRQGLARQLLRQAQSAASVAGARRLLLEVRDSNQRARAVYRAAGYDEIARRRGYYPAAAGSAAEDAIVMALAL